MTISIVLADDHHISREGLRSLLESQDDLTVVAEAEDGRTAVSLVEQHKPDILILDISMPVLNGIEATRQVVRNSPGTRVIVLSMHSEKKYVSEALKAGASGYVIKVGNFRELAYAIQSVVDGHTYLSPRVTGLLVDGYMNPSKAEGKSSFSALSSREMEVLQHLVEGRNAKEIADALFLSVKTVETHRRNAMNKLGVHNLAELIKYAIREGLTTLDT
jgi:two-component system, NarL family, response regulator NreC